MTAWHASIMIRVWTGEDISPSQLLGKSKRIDLLQLAEQQPEEFREFLNQSQEVDDGI
jgi:hypothetical protein